LDEPIRPTLDSLYQYDPIVDLKIPSRAIPVLSKDEIVKKIPFSVPTFGHLQNPNLRFDHHVYAGGFSVFHGVSTMARPANSFDNLAAAVEFRMVRVPRNDPDRDFLKSLVPLFPAVGSFFVTGPEEDNRVFLKLRPGQKRSINACRQLVVKNRYFAKHTTVFCKGDEYKSSHLDFIPRLIFNCHHYYLDKLGSVVGQLSKVFSTVVWPSVWKPYCISNGKIVSAYYTTGAISTDLNRYVNYAMTQKAVSIMVNGDDTWAIDNTQSTIFIECDYRKFDATQSEPLRDVFHQFLDVNMLQEYTAIWKDLYNERVTYRNRKTGKAVVFKGKTGFLTGEPGTSVRNSFTNILVTTRAITSIDPIAAYTKAGLLPKYKSGKEHYRTFLRGVFLLNQQHQLCWIKLPSFLLKFGKFFTNPYSVYPSSWSASKKLQQMLLSTWLGYGHMNSNWFYGAIGKNIFRLCPDAIKIAGKNSEYNVFCNDKEYIMDEDFDSFMLYRYSISHSMMLSFVEFLNSVPSIPCRYWHPLLNVLEEIDYF
jgi:hypothetical protein